MTEGEILAMTSGNDLDIRVAEDVMGYRHIIDDIFGDLQVDQESGWEVLTKYSEDESAIAEVLGCLEHRFHTIIDQECFKGRWQADMEVEGDGVTYYYPDFNAYSLPEAICKAALLAANAVRILQPV